MLSWPGPRIFVGFETTARVKLELADVIGSDEPVPILLTVGDTELKMALELVVLPTRVTVLLGAIAILLEVLVDGDRAGVYMLRECKDVNDASWELPPNATNVPSLLDVGTTSAELDGIVIPIMVTAAALCDAINKLVRAAASAAARLTIVQAKAGCSLKTK